MKIDKIREWIMQEIDDHIFSDNMRELTDEEKIELVERIIDSDYLWENFFNEFDNIYREFIEEKDNLNDEEKSNSDNRISINPHEHTLYLLNDATICLNTEKFEPKVVETPNLEPKLDKFLDKYRSETIKLKERLNRE